MTDPNAHALAAPPPPYIKQWSQGLRNAMKKLSEGLDVSEHACLRIDESVSEQTLGNATIGLDKEERNNQQVSIRLRFAIGRLLNQHAAKRGCSVTEVVSDLDLARDMKKGAKVYEQCARLDQILPEEHRYFDLTWSHYIKCLVEVAAPEEPDRLREFNRRRFELLQGAALDPKQFTSSWIKKKTVELRDEFGLKPKKGTGAGVWKDRYIAVCTALLDWTDQDFLDHETTRQDVVDWRKNYETQLEDLNAFPDIDSGSFRFPFQEPEKVEEKAGDTKKSGAVEVEAEIIVETSEPMDSVDPTPPERKEWEEPAAAVPEEPSEPPLPDW